MRTMRLMRQPSQLRLLLGILALAALPARLDAAGSRPLSFDLPVLSDEAIDHRFVGFVDAEYLQFEDGVAAVERPGQVPLRVAEPVALGLSIDGAGTREALPDGGALWRLRVTSPGAVFLAFTLAGFALPPGAELRFYSVERDYEDGPYTAANNNAEQWFVSPAIPGDSAVIEVSTPAVVPFDPAFTIASVSHGYRDFRSFQSVPRRDAQVVLEPLIAKLGACERDVNCPEGNSWQADKRAVAQTFDGRFICTGTLLNNARGDCRPFFLTANHCVSRSQTAAGMVFYWNYENTTCGGTNANRNFEHDRLDAARDQLLLGLHAARALGPAARGFQRLLRRLQPLRVGAGERGLDPPSGRSGEEDQLREQRGAGRRWLLRRLGRHALAHRRLGQRHDRGGLLGLRAAQPEPSGRRPAPRRHRRLLRWLGRVRQALGLLGARRLDLARPGRQRHRLGERQGEQHLQRRRRRYLHARRRRLHHQRTVLLGRLQEEDEALRIGRGGARRGPLAGLKVLDASRVLAGPYLAMLLADLGADVVKVERPDHGDQTRAWGPPFVEGPGGRASAYFVAANRGKRSLALDLKSPAGRDVFERLVVTADVLVENFLPAEWRRLGFRRRDWRRANPRLVQCTISGYGAGADADRPAYDLVLQAESGLMSLTGFPDGEPVRVGVAVVDVISALYGLTGLLAALRERDATGRGSRVEVSMLDAGTAFLSYAAQSWLADGRQPPRLGSRHPNLAPYQAFRAADGWLVVGVGSAEQWRRFCEAIGRPELADDPCFADNRARIEHRDGLDALLAGILATRSCRLMARSVRRGAYPGRPGGRGRRRRPTRP